MSAAQGDAREASFAFVAPLVALAMGHMLSNAVRTLPAIAADLLGRDLAVTAEGLASLTGTYHFAFAAAQIPIGVALDRFGVRKVALTLLAIIVGGSVLAAFAQGPLSFVLGQVVLGIGCGGMLICPMTLAAKLLSPARFGLWSGLIQALGNVGMLMSASPLALLIEADGWRAGYWACAAFGGLVIALVALIVHDRPVGTPDRTLAGDAREVVRLVFSRALIGLVVLAFASFAVVIGVRGLWGGPWLMEVKGLPRVAAGNVLLIATLALAIGPALWGVLDRRIGRRRALLAFGHLAAAGCLMLTALGGALPPAWDAVTLFAFGLLVSVQPLTFALTRAAVPPEQTGKALAAVNLSFFLGAAVLQAASGAVVHATSIAGGLVFFAVAVAVCTLAFLALTRR
ncbi:nitrate/nitrite transporter [Roseomonas sp. CCTCC AB2023176]|uniref:MFS transporter n=1 Tax=Roseomonas sp. CCTCC AB2023176 TaxID=3342640 RepID=UPI0035DA9E78